MARKPLAKEEDIKKYMTWTTLTFPHIMNLWNYYYVV